MPKDWRANPTSSSGQFLLAYHYLAQGNNEAAGTRFQKVVELVPTDQLSAGFAKLYQKATEVVATAHAEPGGQSGQAGVDAPGDVPAQTAAIAATQPPPEAPAPARPPGRGGQTRQPQPPPPPPAGLVGVWKAQASPDVAIALTLEADGKFTWDVDNKGSKQKLDGIAGFKDNTLALLQQNGPPLVGKVSQDGADKFVFAPDGAGNKAPGLTFAK